MTWRFGQTKTEPHPTTHFEQEGGDDACPHNWLENLDWVRREGRSPLVRRCVACGRLWKSWLEDD